MVCISDLWYMVYDIFFVALTSIDIYTLQTQVFFDAVQTLRIRSLTAKIFSSTVGDASKHRIERPWDIDPIRPGGLVQGGPLPVITGGDIPQLPIDNAIFFSPVITPFITGSGAHRVGFFLPGEFSLHPNICWGSKVLSVPGPICIDSILRLPEDIQEWWTEIRQLGSHVKTHMFGMNWAMFVGYVKNLE